VRRLVWILLTVSCFAQVQGNRPSLNWSATDGIIGGTAGQIITPENIAVGETLIACFATDTGGTYTVSDSLGNTWVNTSPTNTPTGSRKVGMAYSFVTTGGADTVTVGGSPTSAKLQLSNFSHLGAVDGSVATATASGGPSAAIGTISTNQTTTVNQALLVSCAGSGAFGSQFVKAGNNENSVWQADVNSSLSMNFLHAGAAGSVTATDNTYNDAGAGESWAMQTLAFKPTPTIYIGDSSLPDASQSATYSAQLHCIGGIAAQTYSIVSGSLPTGLSLTGATGAITGTPTGTTQTIGFQCTDGTNTSATVSLTINVVAGFSAPSVLQSKTFNWDAGTPVTLSSPAKCGSIVVVFCRGDDTHGSAGWIQSANGVNNKITDSLGSTIRRYEIVAGVGNLPLVAYVIGPLPTSGTETITPTNNQSASEGRLTNIAVEVSNAQVTGDVASFANAAFIADNNYSAAYTTLVPNTLLLAASTTDSAVTSISLSGGFTNLSTDSDIQGYSIYGYQLVASPSAITATSTITMGSSTNAEFSTLLLPLRPALAPSSCNVFTGAGEKIRRQIM